MHPKSGYVSVLDFEPDEGPRTRAGATASVVVCIQPLLASMSYRH